MSRSSYQNHDNPWFPITILVACALWTHRDMLPTIEYYTVLLFFMAIIAILVTFTYRAIRKASHHFRVDKTTIEEVDSMSGLEFEKYAVMLLKRQGYVDVRLTEKYDLGVDIIAEKDGIRWGIQVKRYSGLVKASAVRQVVAALNIYNCDKAMVITNSYFGTVSQKIARYNNCVLVDRNELMKKFGLDI